MRCTDPKPTNPVSGGVRWHLAMPNWWPFEEISHGHHHLRRL